MPLTHITFSGADDRVAPEHLVELTERHTKVPPEWGILYYPERDGEPRYPSELWREVFLAQDLPRTAVHLCGIQVFHDLLDRRLTRVRVRDLARYGRVQININARRRFFTDTDILNIYRCLADAGLIMILQYNQESAGVIHEFLRESRAGGYQEGVELLFDASMGVGRLPVDWPAPLDFEGWKLTCGYAGGLGPDVMTRELPRVAQAAGAKDFWLDMETAIRSDNAFDLNKVNAVLTRAAGGVYFASKVRHAPRWRKARSAGVHVVSTWIDEAGEGETADYSELANRCLEEVSLAERLVLYCEDGDILKGALVEAGAALMAGIPVFHVGDCPSISRVFLQHPLWHPCQTVEEALAKAPRRAS